MLIGMIQGATRIIGKAQGFKGLPVLDTTLQDGTPVMYTVHTPTPAELEILNAGGNVLVSILGTEHPPIYLGVSPP